MSDGICMKSSGDAIYLRGDGKLNARNCDEFKQRVFKLVQNGIKAVHLDLAKCSYMDSTFLGLLVGLHKMVRQHGGSGLTVYSPSIPALEHISSMGIDKLIRISPELIEFPPAMEMCTPKETRSAKDILAAHQHLMELSPENRRRFKILAQVLEKEIQGRKA